MLIGIAGMVGSGKSTLTRALASRFGLQHALESVDDRFFNKLARTVNKIPQHKRSIGRIFAHALIRHPQLIPVAARFFV